MKNSAKLRNRKAQITAYIVIGAIILLSAIVIIYYNSVAVKSQITAQPYSNEAPLEMKPVQSFVDSCLASVSEQGLRELGRHGGYVDLSRNNVQINRAVPTESDGVNFLNNDVAYWWYLKSNNECKGACEFSSKRPKLYKTSGSPSIEGQLEDYTEEHLHECLDDFNSFTAQGMKISDLGNSTVSVNVRDSDIVVNLDYPINIEQTGVSHRLSKFSSVLPINMKRIFFVATNISEVASNNGSRFTESFTQEWISIFSGTTKDKLPGVSDVEFKATGTVWSEEDVRTNIQQMLMTYVPIIQVQNSLNYRPVQTGDKLRDAIYNNFIIGDDKVSTDHKNLDIEFNYMNWPIYLDLNCKGGVCKPEQVFTNSIFIPMGIQRYTFAYDVSYPIVVSVSDPTAFEGRGYQFDFALESNIRNNKPLNENFTPVVQIDMGETSLLCSQRNSGNVTLAIYDSKTKELIDDAAVIFDVGDEGCVIGSTKTVNVDDGRLKNASMVSQFPAGACGRLIVTKAGYVSNSQQLCLSADESTAIKLSLDPIIEKKITIKKMMLVKADGKWVISTVKRDLIPTEEAMLTFDRVAENGQGEFTRLALVNNQKKYDTMEIAPGKYRLTGNLMLKEQLTVPEAKKKECAIKIIGIELSCTEYTIPPVVFTVFPEGTLNWDDNYSYVTITQADLDRSSNIEFTVLALDLKGVPEGERKVEDLEQLDKLPEYSKSYASFMKPVFSK